MDNLRRGPRAALLLFSVLAAAVSVAALLPSPAYASAQAVAADHQNYVSDAGPDAWSANNAGFGGTAGTPDQVDMHVGAAPHQATYTSFAHLELDAIPQDATITSLKLTLHPTDDELRQGENQNAGTTFCPSGAGTCTTSPDDAVIDAFPLKVPYPATFDQSRPPAIDTSGPEAVGLVNSKDGSWTFELAPLVAYWQRHGNTGLAIVPDAAATLETWQVGFYMAATSAHADYTIGAAAATGPGGVTVTYSGGGLPAVALPPAAAQSLGPGAEPPSATAPAPVRRPAQLPNRGAVSQVGSAAGMVPLWLLVLTVSVTAAVALLVQPATQALAAAGGIGPALARQVRVHPRMVAVAGALLLWSSTFGIYSNTVGRTVLGSSLGGGGGSVAGGAPTQAGGETGSGATPSASATGGSGSGEAAAAPGSSGAYANSPNPPSANLYPADQETVGLTDSQIFLCAHAALTFGPAFNIGASDLNVFWDMVDAEGGVWNRKVVYYNNGTLTPGINVTDDGYQPSKAVVAAQQCQDEQGGDFFLLGGIGFDQIPAVRVWAEQHHMVYIHHIALQAGSDGMRYSFTMLPTLELVGQQFGQYYLSKYAGQKIGIIERNSSNWEAGSQAFKETLQQAGQYPSDTPDEYVQNNQGQYAQEISDLQLRGAKVVLIWENALAAEQIIQQANQQGYNPYWIGFPFNLTLQTLNTAGVPLQDLQKFTGMVPWPAYTCHASNLPQFSAYAEEIRQFENAYAKYDPGANLCGVGGDLLFGTWEAWRQVYDLLYQCGRACTRDKIAGLMLSGYHATVGANCAVDFRGGDGHHGGFDEDVYQVQVVNGSPAWVNVPPLCRRNIT